MRRTIFETLALATLSAMIVISPALGQSQQSARVLGKIERVEGDTLVIKTAGSERRASIVADTTVLALVRATLSDVKPGDFIAVGATPLPDDSQEAIRVNIFPESMRGLGEGHRPWNRPGTTMTNATVDTTVSSVKGQVVTVKYKGGEKKIIIRPDATVMAFVMGDKNELKAGASVAISGMAKPDGTVESTRVVVGRGGVVPD